MNRIPIEKQEEIQKLRRLGFSIPEIALQTATAKTTVTRYVKGIEISKEYLQRLKEKQGGAKERAAGLRANVLTQVQGTLGVLSERDRLVLLIGLYWGEGTKRDFSMINSDPFLIQAFITCLYSIGVSKARLSLSLRLHAGLSVLNAKKFWSKTTGIKESSIGRIEIIEGKKKGKLPYGMCRVRVTSGIRDRLLIQSAISIIGKDAHKRLVSS